MPNEEDPTALREMAHVVFDSVRKRVEGMAAHLPTVEEVIGLTALQFRAYCPERQVRLTTLRKQMWREGVHDVQVEALLFLCEVPRIFAKKEGAYREGGEFLGSRGTYERTGGACQLKDSDRAKGIRLRLDRAHRVQGMPHETVSLRERMGYGRQATA